MDPLQQQIGNEMIDDGVDEEEELERVRALRYDRCGTISARGEARAAELRN